MNKFAAKQLAIFVAAVIIVAMVIYSLNYWFWRRLPENYRALLSVTQNDLLLFEGIATILLGFLLLLGRGGIDLWSIRAAVLGAAADAVYGRKGEGRKAPSPNEVLREDVWKPSGFIRPGLVLICAGVILILLYFFL